MATLKTYPNEDLARLPGERRQRILQDIQEQGAITITDLSKRYQVSGMTIRRDLLMLEEEGHITRTHGGALRRTGGVVEPRYAAKQKLYASQKTRIAQYAAEHLVDDGDIILLEGGTTATSMAQFLGSKQNLTVVTNGLYTTNELRHLLPKATIICTGGMLRDVSFTFVGPTTEQFFQTFHTNKAFISATGLALEAGFTDPSMLETQVKKAMMTTTKRVIMLLDSSKFGVRSLTTVAPLEAAEILVTDYEAPDELIMELRRRGVDVRLVE